MYRSIILRLLRKDRQKSLRDSAKGELLRTDRLETVLNNINDLAGVTAVGVLRAGQANGTSDFVIDLRADKPQQTILYTDNYGNKYSGRYRYGFQTTINNPGRIGDKFFWVGCFQMITCITIIWATKCRSAAAGQKWASAIA